MAEQPAKILLVEDNPEDVRLVQETLVEVNIVQFKLVPVERLDLALKLLGEEGFDLVLLDLTLPDSQGLETFVATHTQAPNIPIIVLTSLNDESLALKAMQLGAQDYLIKGQVFGGDLLVRSVRYAIERQRAEVARRQQTERERLVAEMTQRIRQSLKLEEILRTTVSEVRQFLQTERVFIYRFLADWSGLVAVESVAPGCSPLLGAKIKDSFFGETASRELYKQGRIQATADIYTSGLSPCHIDLLARLQIRANLVVSIMQGEQLWGLLVANHCSAPRQWQMLEIDLLKQLTAQLAIAIQQSTLFEQVQTELNERKCAEQKIREQATLIDVATDAIIVRDLNNKILFWNKSAESLYGWKAEEALGLNALQVLFQEQPPSLPEIQKTVVEKGSWQGELSKVNKAGKLIIVESRWTLVRDEQAQPKSILTVDTDITQKKQLEAQFLRAQRLESLGTLASGIAHDLNNVLAPILMSVQLLQLRFPQQQHQQLLQTLESNVKRGADLVKQVLSFARGLEGKRTIVQVRHLILEIIQIAKQTFPKSIEVETHISNDLWTISGDVTQLHQVLMNLAVNARDAMPCGGTLTLTAENFFIDEHYAESHLDAHIGSYVLITVADTGTGIPPEIIERIFEPFFTTKEVGQGTGLGLSTVLGIIKGHGGFVNVYSEVARGTQFKVYLPASLKNQTQPVQDFTLPEGQGELILVVDDELAIREITKTTLETSNYRVLTASDGLEALELYVQHRQGINVVLVDLMMPQMDGAITIRTLQKINPQVKLIAISGLVSNAKIAETAGMGVKAFLSKPCTAMELVNTINAVLSAN